MTAPTMLPARPERGRLNPAVLAARLVAQRHVERAAQRHFARLAGRQRELRRKWRP